MEATKERQINALKEEKDILLNQLDTSTRFCDNQRVEIAQLRKQLMRYNGLGFGGTNNGGPNNVYGKQSNNNQGQHINGGQSHNYTDDVAIQMSDEFQGSQFQLEHGSQVGWTGEQDQGSIILNNEQIRVRHTI